MTDQDSLADEPFTFVHSKDGRARISYNGRVVTTLAGETADKISRRLANASSREAQLIMAKATGNFKRGNERLAKL